jgi:uncharacterized protein YbaR (Trm112 family)
MPLLSKLQSIRRSIMHIVQISQHTCPCTKHRLQYTQRTSKERSLQLCTPLLTRASICCSTYLPIIQGHGGRTLLKNPIIFHPRTQRTYTQKNLLFWKTGATHLAFQGVTSCCTDSLLVHLRHIVSNGCKSN